VVRSVKKDGWAVLNAEDENCVGLAKGLDCKVAYFSMNEAHPVIVEHCKAGGIAAIYENGYVTIKKGDWKIRIEKVTTIPLTFGGRAKFMIGNILAASLAAYLFGFKTEGIKLSLGTFIPSPALTPGRMNIFNFKNFTVMIDFAHNPAGFIAIDEFLSTINSPKKIGIMAGVGDRRDQDIVEIGRLGAKMFDHIIIRQEKHLRGRLEEDIVALVVEGIKSVDKHVTYETIPKEVEAIKHAISIAEPGTFIVALSDVVTNAIDIVQEYLDKDSEPFL
jgi:cyanophycin synthetase